MPDTAPRPLQHMPPQQRLQACHVRPPTVDDLPLLLTWRNHPQVRRVMVTQHEITLAEHAAWFARASQDTDRRLLVVTEPDGAPLGFVQFSPVSAGGVADWGFYARPDAPPGSGRRLGNAALDHAFDVLKLHKVCGQTLAFNTRSIALHQRLGFRQEGGSPEALGADGEQQGSIFFGLLASDWRALRAQRHAL